MAIEIGKGLGQDVEISLMVERSVTTIRELETTAETNAASGMRGILGANGFLFSTCLLGIGIRTIVYLCNRPFWTDEAQLALNLRDRALLELFGKLDYCQAAPPGFLLLEKALITWFGESELVFRSVPFIAGVTAQILFAVFARRILQPQAAAFSVISFAISEALIRYSTEFKQYSLDVLFALLIWLAFFPSYHSGRSNRFRSGAIALVAAIAPWFSFASLLILPVAIGAGTTASFKRDSRRSLAAWMSAWGIFAVSSFTVYELSLSGVSCGPCKDSLMDDRAVPPLGLEAIGWFTSKIFDILTFPCGFIQLATGLAFLFILIGFWQLRKEHPFETASICLPVFLAACGACLSVYPFFGRFVLFALPAAFVLVARGAQWLHLKSKDRDPWMTALLCAILLCPRLDFVGWKRNFPQLRQTEVKRAIEFIAKNRKKSDIVYLYYGAYFPAIFYCRGAQINEDELTVGVPGYWWNSELRQVLLTAWSRTAGAMKKPDNEVYRSYDGGDFSAQWKLYETDIARLTGQGRVWVLFSLTNWLGSDEEKLFLYFLDRHGRFLQRKQFSGASVYLYEFPPEPNNQEQSKDNVSKEGIRVRR